MNFFKPLILPEIVKKMCLLSKHSYLETLHLFLDGVHGFLQQFRRRLQTEKNIETVSRVFQARFVIETKFYLASYFKKIEFCNLLRIRQDIRNFK